MTQKNSLIYMIAGELSGDLLASQTIKSFNNLYEGYLFRGVGGDHMQEAGMDLFCRYDAISVMGITGVLSNLKTLYKSYKAIVADIMKHQPAMVICVDFPDMNMLIAKKIRRLGYQGKIIQLVSPTIWAWRPRRKEKVEKYFDALLTIYPFEKELYSANFTVEYIGNPVKERIDKLNISVIKDPHLIVLFPGSRTSEIESNLPLFLEAYKNLQKSYSKYKLGISIAKDSLKEKIQTIVKEHQLEPICHFFSPNERFEAMQKAAFSMATSGTVTLELALLGVPTVVTYSTSALNRFLGKYILRITVHYFCIANILLDKPMFQELTHIQPTVENVYEALIHLIKNPNTQKQVKEDCENLHSVLGSEAVADKSAEMLYRWLHFEKKEQKKSLSI